MDKKRTPGMDEAFAKAHLNSKNMFRPTDLEWLGWLGQPMIYDGGLCVNRTKEEHEAIHTQTRGRPVLCI